MYLHKKIVFNHMFVLGCLSLVLAGCEPTPYHSSVHDELIRAADQSSARGEIAPAEELYRHALKENPHDPATADKLANLMERHGDNAGARQEYEAALDTSPNDPVLLRDYGRALLKAGKPSEALDEYEHALEINSSDIKALNGSGIALDYLGNHSAAQKIYESALAKKPGDMVTINNLSHSYVLAGSYDQAIKILEPYADDKTAPLVLRQNLAEAYGLSGMEADATRINLKDLQPADVERNMNFYRAERQRLALVPAFYADLGTYPTSGMVSARIEALKADFSDETEGLIIENLPQLQSIGGTPSFSLRVSGFTNIEKLHNFCQKLKENKVNCQPVTRN